MADLPNNQKPEEEKIMEEKPIEIGSIDDENLAEPTPPTPGIKTDTQTPQTQEMDNPTDKPINKVEEKPEEKMPPLSETQTEPAVGDISNVGNANDLEKNETEESPEPTNESPIEEKAKTEPIDMANMDEFGSKPKKKINVKSISSILGILIIIAALPITMMLVKQRQEIRKEAASPGLSGSVSLCGITVSPTGGSYNNGVYTFNYSINSNDGKSHKVVVHTYGCACAEGNRGSCGTSSGKCSGNSQTVNTNYSGTIKTPNIGDCGTHQADVFIISVDERSECHTN